MIAIFMVVRGVPTGNGWLFRISFTFSIRHIASLFDLTSVPLATSVWMPLKNACHSENGDIRDFHQNCHTHPNVDFCSNL